MERPVSGWKGARHADPVLRGALFVAESCKGSVAEGVKAVSRVDTPPWRTYHFDSGPEMQWFQLAKSPARFDLPHPLNIRFEPEPTRFLLASSGIERLRRRTSHPGSVRVNLKFQADTMMHPVRL